MFFFFRGVFFFLFLYGASVLGIEDFSQLTVKRKVLSGITVQAQGVILMNLQTGVVLYEKNADEPLYPASLAKVATALFIMEKKPHILEETALVSREATRVQIASKRQGDLQREGSYCLEYDGVSLSLIPGERVSCKHLFESMLVFSANDAANVLAEHCGGSISLFMEEMAVFLREEVGCASASLNNPHGLHDPEQKVSARDLALITQRAMQYSLFRDIVNQPQCTVVSSLGGERSFEAKNKLLVPGKYYYPFTTGVKTGYTMRSKLNLIATAKKEERELLFIVLGCREQGAHFEQAKQVFERVFKERKKTRVLVPSLGTSLYTPESRFFSRIPVKVCQDVSVSYYPSEEPDNLSAEILWERWPLIHAPQTQLGSLVVFAGGKEISRTGVISTHGVSWLQAIGLLHRQWKILLSIFVLLFLIFLGRLKRRKEAKYLE